MYHSKLEFCVRTKLARSWRSEDRGVKQDAGSGVFVWRGFEEEEVAIGTQAANEGGAWRGIDGEAEVADGDFAIVADADL